MNLQDASLSELKKICQECHLKDQCGECRIPVYKERALERELYSIHTLCVNSEGFENHENPPEDMLKHILEGYFWGENIPADVSLLADKIIDCLKKRTIYFEILDEYLWREKGREKNATDLSYSKAEHYRKFNEWKNGKGAHFFAKE